MADGSAARRDGLKVLLLGAGAREHALAAALDRGPSVASLAVAPGNPGTAAFARNVPLDLGDPAAAVDVKATAAAK